MTLEEIAADKRVEAISIGFVGTSDSGVAVRLNDGRWQVVDLNGTSTAICTTEELERFAILLTALVPAHQRDDTAELAKNLWDTIAELSEQNEELIEALEAVPIVRFNEPGTDGFLSCPGCGATGSEPCEIDCYVPKVEAALAAYRERNK